jgi:hypothetical protein
MDKGTIFECMAPNGAVITAVVITSYSSKDESIITNICYAQNRIFEYQEVTIMDLDDDPENFSFNVSYHKDAIFGNVLCDYCVIPELDEALKYYAE